MPNPTGFAPIADRDARVLILGSLPGVLSIKRQEYYAHPRNVFWRIIGVVLTIDPALSYERRSEGLKRTGVALWDVCASAQRVGSLDSAIKNQVANDFVTFFAEHAHLKHIVFNGQKAAALYRKVVFDRLPEKAQRLPTSVLPSTSPANAGMTYDEKVLRWRSALDVKPLSETTPQLRRGTSMHPAGRQ